ncbi:GntR family transcriptional regulator [Asticcacaulis sp. 201]|uniref:GntR family transcriptional regulator n=1 Tax=Asticcacaulis sp. 201 TaxID=3028787 RepID=UPI0029160674|nr:GntR family transcriptional regulator [Asticcacaulis sp. 201]MDV6330903.1 GntR family transcriptional regulator [Asticcacaulis sp. 201]
MASSSPALGNRIDSDKDVRAYRTVGESLLERIRKGEFRMLGKLPTERELAEMYNVGRAVIRDALVMLEVKGLVQSRQGSGIYITRRAYELETADTGESVKARPWDSLAPSGPAEFLQAQQWFESHLSRLAALSASEDDLLELERLSEECRTAPHAGSRAYTEMRFHLRIARATQNPELISLAHHLWQRRDNSPLWHNFNGPATELKGDRWTAARDKLVAAFRRRDGDAAFVAMWQYIEEIGTFLTHANAVAPDLAGQGGGEPDSDQA